MSAPPPPATPKRPCIWEHFGRRIVDDYAWIRQATWFQDLRTPELLDPAIRNHLEAENAYADAVLAPAKALQDELAAEMIRRASGDDGAPADPDGDWGYFARTAPGAEYPRMLRRPRGGGDEQLLLDVAAEAAKAPYYRLSEFALATPSPDHRLYAWAADEAGDQHFRLYVKDLETGALASSVVESCYGSFCFSPDSKWLFWVNRDAMSRPTKVFRRPAMGGEDVLVYEEMDPRFYLAVERSRSSAFVQVRVYSGTASEVWLIPAADPTAAPRLVEPRAEGVIYDLEHWNDRFVVRTNADGAVDYKLMLAKEADPSRAGW
jgi:oligopeptidase B